MKPTGVVRSLVQYVSNPLRKNSIFLIATHMVIALFGFFFWRIAESRYGTEDVGLASALVSAVLLLHTLARLGLDVGLIRFLPNETDKPGMINASFTIVSLVSAVLALIFILGVRVWAEPLARIRDNSAYALLFVLFTVVVALVELLRQGVFVAYRKTQSSLAIEVMAGLRLPLLFAFLSVGAFGIFVSWGLAGGAALVVGMLLVVMIQRNYRPALRIRWKGVGSMVRFSLGNYVAETFRELPGFILPLVVIRVFTAEMGAYFYIAWTIASVIMMISYATSSSLLAEGSLEPDKFRSNAMRAVKFMLLLLVPVVVLVLLLGGTVLAWFGEDYSDNAFPLLCTLSVSGIPLALNTIYVTQMRIQRRIWPVICLYAFVASFTIGVGYALMDRMELLGIGVAWLSSNCIVALIVGGWMARRWMQGRSSDGQGNAEVST